MGNSSYLRDARHVDKFAYILNNSLFYEPFEHHYQPSDEYISILQSLLNTWSTNWRSIRDGIWFHAFPSALSNSDHEATRSTNIRWPAQGWKVHVSAIPDNATKILAKVAWVALLRNIPFKFCLDKNVLLITSSKPWPRGSSGKFITLYPATVSSLSTLLQDLYTELRDEVGPYILSDRRYRDCRVLYYRFGGIAQIHRTDIKGEKIPLLIAPDGSNIPDYRLPYFVLPPWLEDPFPCAAATQEALTLNAGRYIVKKALSFSNSGGVYLAEDRATNTDVVIKEARPYTAVDTMGNDAVARLKQEFVILGLFRGKAVTARPFDAFHEWENFFLVEEYLPGISIRDFMLTKSPLTCVRPSLANGCEFYEIFTQLFISFIQAVDTFHEQGVVLGDLSANNFKIDPSTYAVRIFDFETSFRPPTETSPGLYTPGFKEYGRVRRNITGFEDDLYSLSANMLYAMFPFVALSYLRDDLCDAVLPILLADLGWSDTEIFSIVKGLSANELSCKEAAEMLKKPVQLRPPAYSDELKPQFCAEMTQQLGEFLLESMCPKAKRSLFPADPFLHYTNPISLGFGACGVMYALKKCGFELPVAAYDWLDDALSKVQPDELPPGLLTGSAGIAWSTYELGLRDKAEAFMKMANESLLVRAHHSYYYGMAGIGLANLYFFLQTDRSEYLATALSLAQALLDSALENDRGIHWSTDNLISLGYGYGQSGVALFFLRLSQLTSKTDLFVTGRRALEFDLSYGVEIEDGIVSFTRSASDTTTFEHYIEEGSAGIAKVAMRYNIWDRTEMILADSHRKYVSFAGLLFGLAGFVDVFTDAFLLTNAPRFLELAKRPIAGLKDFFLIKQSRGFATPGDNLLRISCDYATGVAGVLRSLHRFSTFDPADFVLDEIEEREQPGRLATIQGLKADAAIH